MTASLISHSNRINPSLGEQRLSPTVSNCSSCVCCMRDACCGSEVTHRKADRHRSLELAMDNACCSRRPVSFRRGWKEYRVEPAHRVLSAFFFLTVRSASPRIIDIVNSGYTGTSKKGHTIRPSNSLTTFNLFPLSPSLTLHYLRELSFASISTSST